MPKGESDLSELKMNIVNRTLIDKHEHWFHIMFTTFSKASDILVKCYYRLIRMHIIITVDRMDT